MWGWVRGWVHGVLTRGSGVCVACDEAWKWRFQNYKSTTSQRGCTPQQSQGAAGRIAAAPANTDPHFAR